MSENLHKIDELFKGAIDHYKEMPDQHVWNSISTNLDKYKIKKSSWNHYRLKESTLIIILLLLCIGIHDLKIKSLPEAMKVTNNAHKIDALDMKKSVLKSDNVSGIALTHKNLLLNITPEDNIIKKTKNNLTRKTSSLNKKDQEPVLYSDSNFPGNFEGSLKVIKNTDIPFAENKIALNTKNSKTPYSAFSATVYFSQSFAFYLLKEDELNNSQGNENEIRNTESQELSTIAGIWLDYKLNDGWSLQTGINFSNTVILIDPKTIYAEPDNLGNIKFRYNSSSGYGYVLPSFANFPRVGDSLYAFDGTHTLQYIGIPIAAKYYFKKGKFNLYAAAGISGNVLLKGTIETELKDGANNENEVMNKLNGLKQIYFSGSVDVGAEYSLTNKFSFLMSPYSRFALNSINKNAIVKSYPYSFGISAGIRMKF